MRSLERPICVALVSERQEDGFFHPPGKPIVLFVAPGEKMIILNFKL